MKWASLKIAEYFWPYQPRWLQMLCDWWTPIIWVKSVWNVRMQNLFLLTKKTGNVAFVETTTTTSRAVCRSTLFTRLVNLFPGMETDWPIMVVRHAFLACLLACFAYLVHSHPTLFFLLSLCNLFSKFCPFYLNDILEGAYEMQSVKKSLN